LKILGDNIARFKFILSLIIIFPSLNSIINSQSFENTPDPYEIIEKGENAINVFPKIDSIETYFSEAIGYIELVKIHWQSFFWYKGQKYRHEIHRDKHITINGYNGQFEWKYSDGETKIVEDEDSEKELMVSELYDKDEHLNPESKIFKVSYEGTGIILDKVCHMVKIYNNITFSNKIEYYDTTNFLNLLTIKESQNDTTRQYYYDYREVEGILFPFKNIFFMSVDSIPMVDSVSRIEINKPISDTIFDPPRGSFD
jgi:hypothetical protein